MFRKTECEKVLAEVREQLSLSRELARRYREEYEYLIGLLRLKQSARQHAKTKQAGDNVDPGRRGENQEGSPRSPRPDD